MSHWGDVVSSVYVSGRLCYLCNANVAGLMYDFQVQKLTLAGSGLLLKQIAA